MIMAWLALFNGLIGIVLAVAGIGIAHFAVAAPFTGFLTFVGGLAFGALGVLCALFALMVMMFSPRRRIALKRAVVGGMLGLVVVAPVVAIVRATLRYPPINDITTDTTNPPEFSRAPL